MPTTKLINAVYKAVGALKIKANGINAIEFLEVYEQEEQTCNGKNAPYTPAYTASLLNYIGYEVEGVCEAVEELPLAYFNLCFRECVPMAGFSACALSMLVALHIIEYVLLQEFTSVEEYTQFMQNMFTPLAYNEV